MKQLLFALLAFASPQVSDPLDALHIHVTTGAAPGYVDDKQCATCHSNIAKTYKQVGMSKAFYRPRQDDAIEDFAKLPLRHARSGDVMELRWRDGKLIFRRWQLDDAGHPLNLFEQPVDWILGSGHHARTYLYQTPGGEIYQLPIAWYSQTKEWAMAPGFDRADHQGVLRRVRHECMFCHNAYPEIEPNARDGHWRTQTLPVSLPEGLGCQRCHGPGAEHVRRALANADDASLRAAIVNPARLDAAHRKDVCYECHMQPAVAMMPIRRIGRDIDSFRPGEALADYELQLDIVDPDMPKSERFEINHAPYRLEQSRCYLESGGKVFCLDCHDPHRGTKQVRDVCQSCHANGEHVMAKSDCVSCHMPKRRTQDVVHVVMTDHKIRKPVVGVDLLAPREERDPSIAEILAPPGAELYRTLAAMRIEKAVPFPSSPEIEPRLDVAAAQLRAMHYDDVEKTTRAILERAPDHPLATEWLGLARLHLGAHDEGLELLRKAIRLDPKSAEFQYNLGLRGSGDEALVALQRAVALRPNFVLAWFHLGEMQRGDAAIAAYRRTLEIDPRFTRAYLAVGRALLARGDREEAMRYLRHGAKVAARPAEVQQALDHLSAP